MHLQILLPPVPSKLHGYVGHMESVAQGGELTSGFYCVQNSASSTELPFKLRMHVC